MLMSLLKKSLYPTFKEWKLGYGFIVEECDDRLYPTFKEWKPLPFVVTTGHFAGLYPTFKEWKPLQNEHQRFGRC